MKYVEKAFKTIINMFKYLMENKTIMRRGKNTHLNRTNFSRGENTIFEIKISLGGISRRLVMWGKKRSVNFKTLQKTLSKLK